MFPAALFTIVKAWKQSKCPLTDAWVKEIRYMYIMGYSVQFSHSVMSDSATP